MASEHWPTYVVLAVYLALTAVVTMVGYRQNKDPSDKHTDITKHFLASKDFGMVILTFTTFASVFSGYTVVGVPTETGHNGFFAIRWLSSILVVGVALSWLFPRLRRLSTIRNYQSPGDFIEDRFKSQAVSIMVALLTCVPQVLYIGTNLFSLGSVVNSMTGGELGFYAVAVASVVIILVFEALGGMRSVAYTDAVEAIVMVSIFVAVPILITVWVGGFIGQVNNSHGLTVPCANANADATSGCLNFAAPHGVSEYYLRSPSSVTVLNYVLFNLTSLSFCLNPHITQRALTGRTDWHIRFVMCVILVSAFLTMAPGILMGVTYISNWPEMGAEYQAYGAYQAILSVFRDKGGLYAAVSYVALLAGIAGIMSTADSALIGVSNTISVDVFKNWLLPAASSRTVVYIGKAVSLVTMCLGLVFAIFLWETQSEYGVVLTIQQGLLFQAVPAYAFGLYTDVGTNAVALGTAVGTLADVVLVAVVFGGYDPIPLVDKSWSTMAGVLVNVAVAVAAHYTLFSKERGDHEDALGLDKIRQVMKGISEPVTKHCGACMWLSLACVMMPCLHWLRPVDDELVEALGEQEARALMYNGEVCNVIWGLPDWVFSSMLWYVAGIAFGVAGTLQWTVQEEAYAIPAESASQVQRKRCDPDGATHTPSALDGEIEMAEAVAVTVYEETDAYE